MGKTLNLFPRLAVLLVTSACCLAACTRTLDLQEYASRPGYIVEDVAGSHFTHRVVFRKGEGDRLHVYIEGDGRPWVTPTSRATDPTPRHPLLLDLMAADPAPSLYLGRPCYFHTNDPQCSDDRWWTSHRYSQEVVDSMAAVLAGRVGSYSGVTLIGYSGGGTLAFLLASRIASVDTVITLSANLDVDAWARDNGYSRLTGSLNPAALAGLPGDITQLHYWASEDQRVSLKVVESVSRNNPGAQIIVLDGIDHNCCWQQVWPQILARLP